MIDDWTNETHPVELADLEAQRVERRAEKARFNERLVRQGICWRCARRAEDRAGGWIQCAHCGDRWKVGPVILERIPVPDEIIGRRAGSVWSDGVKLVWDVGKINESTRMVGSGADWLIPVGAHTETKWETRL